MSEYASLYGADYEIDVYANEVPEFLSAIFTVSDKLQVKTPFGLEDEEGVGPGYQYRSTVKNVMDRLDAAGYSLHRASELFSKGKVYEVERLKKINSESDEYEENTQEEDEEEALGAYNARIDFYENVEFEEWLDLMKLVVENRLKTIYPLGEWKQELVEAEAISPRLRTLLDAVEDYYSGENNYSYCFPVDNPLYVYRVVLNFLSPDDVVILDYSSLVGYTDPSWHEIGVPSKTVIITEGSSDTRILNLSLRIRYPHLQDYYSFLDFGSVSMQGGSGQLLNTVRAFAGAGIQQRMIAIFDNDTAGHDALRQLSTVSLPENIKAISLPDLSDVKSYPTIGPQGELAADLNGRACSIELYLGTDVLTGDDGELARVQWTGYNQPMRRYQGEILGKGELQKKYIELLEAGGVALDAHDWSGMDAIWHFIFRQYA
jgi:hypothetical protein